MNARFLFLRLNWPPDCRNVNLMARKFKKKYIYINFLKWKEQFSIVKVYFIQHLKYLNYFIVNGNFSHLFVLFGFLFPLIWEYSGSLIVDRRELIPWALQKQNITQPRSLLFQDLSAFCVPLWNFSPTFCNFFLYFHNCFIGFYTFWIKTEKNEV